MLGKEAKPFVLVQSLFTLSSVSPDEGFGTVFPSEAHCFQIKEKTIWEVNSLLPLCESQGLSLGHQTWQQTTLSAEPSHWPYPLDFNGTYAPYLGSLPSSIDEVSNKGPVSCALGCSESRFIWTMSH